MDVYETERKNICYLMGQIEQERPIFSKLPQKSENDLFLCIFHKFIFMANPFIEPKPQELLVMLASNGSGILSHLGKIHYVMKCLYLKSQRKEHRKLDKMKCTLLI